MPNQPGMKPVINNRGGKMFFNIFLFINNCYVINVDIYVIIGDCLGGNS